MPAATHEGQLLQKRIAVNTLHCIMNVKNTVIKYALNCDISTFMRLLKVQNLLSKKCTKTEGGYEQKKAACSDMMLLKIRLSTIKTHITSKPTTANRRNLTSSPELKRFKSLIKYYVCSSHDASLKP